MRPNRAFPTWSSGPKKESDSFFSGPISFWSLAPFSKRLSVVWLLGWLVLALPEAPFHDRALGADEPPSPSSQSLSRDDADEPDRDKQYRNEVISGRVGWLAAFLNDRFGITTVPEVAKQSLAVLTDDGEVVPLAENVRARAFRKDERLRDKPLELWVRRYEQQPFAQVLKIVELQDGQRYEVDYWCDVCAIPMYETGPCSCCQDHNRIRRRLLVDGEPGPDLPSR